MSNVNGRTLAIGDIHGCAFALDALLRSVKPTANDTIIALGDFVDYGLDSAGVLDHLIQLRQRCHLIAIRGNHEEMMMQARQSREHLHLWKSCGGDATLIAMEPNATNPSLSDVPQRFWEFLDGQCVDFHETASHIFVHGGVQPDVPLRDQTLANLRWRRFDSAQPHNSGKIVICGHTPRQDGRPQSKGHTLCIDTFAHGGGYLTCLDAATGQYWQANEKGKLWGDFLR